VILLHKFILKMLMKWFAYARHFRTKPTEHPEINHETKQT